MVPSVAYKFKNALDQWKNKNKKSHEIICLRINKFFSFQEEILEGTALYISQLQRQLAAKIRTHGCKNAAAMGRFNANTASADEIIKSLSLVLASRKYWASEGVREEASEGASEGMREEGGNLGCDSYCTECSQWSLLIFCYFSVKILQHADYNWRNRDHQIEFLTHWCNTTKNRMS